MDYLWFKNRMKAVGAKSADIARIAQRDRTAVSHILTGRQLMNLHWAEAFAEALNTDVGTILERAGVTSPQVAQQLRPGFADSDAAPWVAPKATPMAPAPPSATRVAALAQALGQRAGVDIWQVRSRAMALEGMLPGDYMLVDTLVAERTRAGDVVVAQIYDNTNGTATTVLRRHEPPVLVAASPDPEDRRVHVIDGTNVVVRGRVVACWRQVE